MKNVFLHQYADVIKAYAKLDNIIRFTYENIVENAPPYTLILSFE
jgi:hypothetical protein